MTLFVSLFNSSPVRLTYPCLWNSFGSFFLCSMWTVSINQLRKMFPITLPKIDHTAFIVCIGFIGSIVEQISSNTPETIKLNSLYSYNSLTRSIYDSILHIFQMKSACTLYTNNIHQISETFRHPTNLLWRTQSIAILPCLLLWDECSYGSRLAPWYMKHIYGIASLMPDYCLLELRLPKGCCD